jgi:hypothetical protein
LLPLNKPYSDRTKGAGYANEVRSTELKEIKAFDYNICYYETNHNRKLTDGSFDIENMQQLVREINREEQNCVLGFMQVYVSIWRLETTRVNTAKI